MTNDDTLGLGADLCFGRRRVSEAEDPAETVNEEVRGTNYEVQMTND